MSLKYYYRLITGKTNAEKPASISWKNIRAVIQAYLRKKRRGLGGFDLDDYMYEQIIWRRQQVMENSPECWTSGSCKVCGCEILGKTMEDRSCEKETPCYPEMMKETGWKEYKKLNNIKLFE